MTSFRRLSAIDQAELAIEQGIAAATWGDRLPSLQNLAKLLGVSTPTAAKAVARLAKRGLVISCGSRRRYRIAQGKAARKAGRTTATTPRRHLLILNPCKPETWDAGRRQVVVECMQQALADGWGCSQETVDFIRARRVLKRWDKLLLQERPTHLFAIQGTRQLAQWARKHDMQVAFVGGESLANGDGTNIGIGFSDILGHCVRHLRSKGHRHILLPYWGSARNFAKAASRIVGRNLDTDPARLLSEGWIFAAPHSTPDEHRARLARHLGKLQPTAVIAIDWHDYVVTAQCAEAAGLRIPQDLSLVVLNPSPDTRWTLPRPAHYQINQSFFIDAIRDWRHGKAVDPAGMTQAVLNAWVEGETVLPARTAP